MSTLMPGANTALPSGAAAAITVRTASAHADLIVLCLDGASRADGDDGVALWSQPSCAAGAVTIDVASDTVSASLAALPSSVARLLVVVQADGVPTLADCGQIDAAVTINGVEAARLEISSPDTVQTLQVGELYRHGTGWKVRCLGDGYADGLARLLTVHGVDVDDEPDAGAAAPSPTPAPAGTATQPPVPAPSPASAPGSTKPAVPASLPGSQPTIRLTKGEDQLPKADRQKLSLRKQAVAKVLLEKGVPDVTARVIVVLDASGSMGEIYMKGTMAECVERVAAVAAQLDDDGEMEAWRFASKSTQLPTLTIATLPAWIAHCVVIDALTPLGKRKRKKAATQFEPLGKVGFGNQEELVIADVRRFVADHPAPDPTLVLFFSDGGVYNDEQIERELLASQREPIFWQFIGLGADGGYGVLERFDTLPGREIDNVGFFAVDDIGKLPDDALYGRILSEFPRWLGVARGAGIV